MNKLTIEVSSTHPSLKGHFPGQPIVPAVVILQAVTEAFFSSLAPMKLNKISNAKFIKLLATDTPADISYKISAENRWSLVLTQYDEKIAILDLEGVKDGA